MASDQRDNLVWMDMEMTGLDPKTCVVLEIATLVTDKDLNLLAEGPVLVVYQPQAILDAMDDWNKEHHGKSGLIDQVKNSKITLAQAEQSTLDFVAQHCAPKTSPLCGNTIYQDRRFLLEYMPHLEDFFHYRLIDVSTIKGIGQTLVRPRISSPF